MSVVTSIIWTRSGLYIIKLKATVTLTFDELISKLIGIIYIQRRISVENLKNYINSVSSYLDKVCSIYMYQYVDSHCDFDLGLTDLKINRNHLHSDTHVCAKFDEPMSILCLVIIRTRSGLYINMLTVTVPLTIDQMTSKSIGTIYTPRCMSVPNLMNLGQCRVKLSSGQGLVYI